MSNPYQLLNLMNLWAKLKLSTQVKIKNKYTMM